MQSIHLLNGDALYPSWKASGISGTSFVWRECMCEGPVSQDLNAAFWQHRDRFLQTTLGFTQADSAQYFLGHFYPILSSPEPKAWHLWFDDDLFCCIHLLAICHLLQDRPQDRVLFCEAPQSSSLPPAWWKSALHEAISLSDTDIHRAALAWQAYTSPTPTNWFQLLRAPFPPFPQFHRNVFLHLSRLPHPHHGLNKPQEMAAHFLKSGTQTDQALISHLLKTDPGFGLGDVLFRYHLQEHPHIFSLQQNNWSLTPFGFQVLAREADALQVGYRPYPLGGLAPGPDNWRFDGENLSGE